MRKSNRYELNLVEGSDIVNPLVQDVPNYEIIDEELGKNADAGVPLATELLTGTVHALTRENPNAPMFRFVATANYKSGDTFTVDGVQVTALLTTGEPLATGCYVINSNVLGCLVGTVLTLYCANSLAEIHAVDSDKLGGEYAEYYASANSVVEATNLAQNANQISLANAGHINEMNGEIQIIKENMVSTPQWSKLGTLSAGGTSILPDGWSELFVLVYSDDNAAHFTNTYIKEITSASVKPFYNGTYDNTGWYFNYSTELTNSSIKFKEFHRCGKNASAKMDVYYR